VGCGNGRFGDWLADHLAAPHRYVGLDRSLSLLALASPRRPRVVPRFLSDVVRSAGSIPCRTATYDAVLGLAFLHHVPSFHLRRALIDDLLRVLHPGGILALSFWQFATEDRFRRRMVSWRETGANAASPIDSSEVEEGDHLLAWGDRETPPAAVRYCHHTSPEEADRLMFDQPAALLESYHADGRGGRLNLYCVWRRS
jgi:SAM-dependent methyltransferase